MATSGTTIWTVTRNDIIKAALRKATVIGEGDTPSTEQYSTGVDALNGVVSDYMVEGMQLWAKNTYSFAPTLNTSTYRIGVGQTLNTPFPLKIHQAYITDNNSLARIPLEVISHYNYNLLPRTTPSGQPIQLMYLPQVNFGDIYIWPAPDASAVANKTITIIYQRPLEIFVNSTDTADFPQEWYNALVYGLASALADEYSLPLQDRKMLETKAMKYLTKALEFGTEEASYYFQINRGP